MKPLIAFLLLFSVAFAQEPAAPVTPPPARDPVASPKPTPRPNPVRFANEIEAFNRQAPEKGGIVFTGSSSFRLWPHLKEDFPGLPITNRGFGGCVSNDMIVYFDSIVARHEPKILVTYCGSNDIQEKLSVEEALADYTRFLDMTHDRFPKTKVVLTSVKIAPKRAAHIPRIHEFNRRLEAWVAGKDWVRYVDCTSYLADASDQPIASYYGPDNLHLSAPGYAKWQAILDPILREEWAKVK